MTLIQIITFIIIYYKEVTRWLARLLMRVLCAEAVQVSARSALSLREIPSTRSMRLLASTAAHARVHVPPALSLRLNQIQYALKKRMSKGIRFFVYAGHEQNSSLHSEFWLPAVTQAIRSLSASLRGCSWGEVPAKREPSPIVQNKTVPFTCEHVRNCFILSLPALSSCFG